RLSNPILVIWSTVTTTSATTSQRVMGVRICCTFDCTLSVMATSGCAARLTRTEQIAGASSADVRVIRIMAGVLAPVPAARALGARGSAYLDTQGGSALVHAGRRHDENKAKVVSETGQHGKIIAAGVEVDFSLQ